MEHAPLDIDHLVKDLQMVEDGECIDHREILAWIKTAIYYAQRCAILEGQLTKTRADLREIVSDATTLRVQASLPEDPYPQDPNEV